MQQSEFDDFQAILDATCSMLSRGTYQPNPMSAGLFFAALMQYDMAEVRAAFQAHISDPKRGRFVPTPADIIEKAEARNGADGRPDEEEAWAIALRATDEAATVVWTEEIAKALNEVRPVLNAGDKVGARMSFKSIYSRLLDDARKARQPAKWSASLGYDVEARNVALLPHVKTGRLSSSVLQIEAPKTTLLLEMATSEAAPEVIKEQLRKMLDILKQPREEMPSRDAVDRERTANLKRTAAEKVAQKIEDGAGE